MAVLSPNSTLPQGDVRPANRLRRRPTSTRSVLISLLAHVVGAWLISRDLGYTRIVVPPHEPPPAAQIALVLPSVPTTSSTPPAFERVEVRRPLVVVGEGSLPEFVPEVEVPDEDQELPPPPAHRSEPQPPAPSRIVTMERVRPPEIPPGEAQAPSQAYVPSPVPGHNPPPEYPKLARSRGWEGRVVIGAEIGADGKPVRVWVEASSGRECFDTAALQACASWRFAPAPERGTARTDVVFRFQLRS